MKAVSANSAIREKAKTGIDNASDTTVKMILAMLEVEEQEDGAGYEMEMNRRFSEYESGKIIPLSLDDLEANVRRSHNERLKSRK